MRITIEETNQDNPRKVTVECQCDDLKVGEVMDMARGAITAMGFTEDSVTKHLQSVLEVLSESIKWERT